MESTYTMCQMTLESRDGRLLAQAADRIRQLPGVARVRMDSRGYHLEILFAGHSRHLLREVHTALRLATTEPVNT